MSGGPGVGKTTLAREILKQQGYKIVELNASHTRSGQAFKKQIIPLLVQKSVLEAMSPTSSQHKLAVLLDEIDGLSLGEKGGLSELLDYMRAWKAGKTTHPLLLICNEIRGRAYQHIVRLSTYIQMEFPVQSVQTWLGKTLRPEVLASSDLRVILRSLQGCDSVSIYQGNDEKGLSLADDEEGEPSTEILRFSHSCLYDYWDPLVIPEVALCIVFCGVSHHSQKIDRLGDLFFGDVEFACNPGLGEFAPSAVDDQIVHLQCVSKEGVARHGFRWEQF
jgi:hypothetical protein